MFLDKNAFAESLYRWSKEIGRRTTLPALNEKYTQINIDDNDGKVLRATAKSGL